jgi:hypothetical protein
MAYLQINELNNAKQQLFLALNLNSDPVTQSSIYLNMSRIYTNKNIDSAVYFAKLSESTSTIRKDIHVLSANYQILSQLEEKKGNHREALYYNRQYTACSNRIKNENVLNIQEIETKHELYRLQNKPSYYGVIILCSCLVCVFCVFCVFILGHIYRKKYATMQTSTDEANRKIAELENSTGKMHLIIIELKNNIEKILSKLNENEELMVLYYTILGNIYNSINKLSFDIDFKRMVNNDKNNNRGKDIVTYLQTMLNKVNTWDIVYTTGKSTFDEIQKMYPLLTDREFKITCLAFLGYTNTTIANALNLKDNTVQHDRSIIRNKLGIEPKGDIPSIIRKQLKK